MEMSYNNHILKECETVMHFVEQSHQAAKNIESTTTEAAKLAVIPNILQDLDQAAYISRKAVLGKVDINEDLVNTIRSHLKSAMILATEASSSAKGEDTHSNLQNFLSVTASVVGDWPPPIIGATTITSDTGHWDPFQLSRSDMNSLQSEQLDDAPIHDHIPTVDRDEPRPSPGPSPSPRPPSDVGKWPFG